MQQTNKTRFIDKPTIDIIKTLLKKHPHLRDNDNKLIANIWYLKSPTLSEGALDFLNEIAQGKLPSSESIRRCRQKVQELDKDLRGELWNKRHGMQDQVKEELREIATDYKKQGVTF
mgnify:CR=1 FL=1|tara:strand:+ start:21 stop:371 length:351 start_codon:yes stop_codon:yes gene_type:complete